MNPVAFELGPLTIFWYSIFVLGGFLAGYFILYKEFKKQEMPLDFLSNYFFLIIPIVIIGARLQYVIFRWDSYQNNLSEIFAIWNGGLAIHGGIIAGVIFSIYYAKRHKINILRFLDMCAPSLIIGQAIGRWGNFFNQEAFGNPVEVDVLRSLFIPGFIIDGMKINGVYHHPTFFYEFLLCLLGFIIIMFIRNRKKVKLGVQAALYFIIYGASRFFVEALRTDSLMLGNLRVAQVISIILFLGGLIFLIRQLKKEKNLYYEEKEKKKKKKGRNK